jgi:hypothetical protein
MRYLRLLVGEPDMDDPVPGTPEFMQMLSDYQSATQAMAPAGGWSCWKIRTGAGGTGPRSARAARSWTGPCGCGGPAPTSFRPR